MKIKKEEIFKAIKQISQNNLLSENKTKELIIESVKKAFNSKYDPDAELELIINEEKNIFDLYNNSKLVVKDKEFDEKCDAIEIGLTNAKKINPNIELGEYIRDKVDFTLYSKSISQKIKQIFTQNIREKKKEAIYTKHKELKGKMIRVNPTSVTPTNVTFQMSDGTTAFMPRNLRNPNVKISTGKFIDVYVEDVLEDSKESQIIVSNGSKQLLKKFIEEEVPELKNGIIEIVSISRQSGIRSKISVKSSDPNVDPVGTIIGASGSRINAIVSKLEGEKLDIVSHSDDINVYVANALSPARIAAVVDKKTEDNEIINNYKIAIVPKKHQTLAIGRQGSNVRLAAELVGQKIDVISIEQAKEKEIEYELNVGLSQEDIYLLESGQKIARKTNHSNNFNNYNIVNNNEFDDSIESFTSEMESTDTFKKDDIKIDDDLFSEEQLKEMEEAFEFGTEFNSFDENEDSNEEFSD